MARFRLSTGILSPLNSDISLNDVSVFSFGSTSSTPDKDCDGITSKYIGKDSESNSFSKRTMKDDANVIQVITNDIKRQSDINAEREEKFKESYEVLKQSMDDLFYNKASASILSPISKDEEIGKFTHERKSNSNIIADKTKKPEDLKVYKKLLTSPSEDTTSILLPIPKVEEMRKLSRERKSNSNINADKTKKSQNLKVPKKVLTSASEASSEIKQTERIKKEKRSSSVKREQKNHHLKNICSLKLPTCNTDAKLSHECKTKISTASSSSTQTGKSLEIKQTSKKLSIKGEANERAVKDFQFKTQQKIAVSNHMPTTENKGLSIEKSIEVAVGIEMDKVRSLILDQNIIMRKELTTLQDIVQKQTEVTGYLFSVVDQLLVENKKLISKHK